VIVFAAAFALIVSCTHRTRRTNRPESEWSSV
jgi:hypothetical protein